jgi:hypothetical protein
LPLGSIEAVRTFLAYLNRLVALVLPLFPWDLSKHLTYDSPTGSVSTMADLSRRVRVADGLGIKSTHKSFKITAIMLLAIGENPDLCVDIVLALPSTIF